MKIIQFLHTMLGENIATMTSEAEIYDREKKHYSFYGRGTTIRELVRAYGLTREEVSDLISAGVRLNKTVFLGGILKSGLNCDLCDENGDTPLILAVRIGNKETVKLLLDYGANPLHKNTQGFDAICFAIKQPDILTLFDERYPMLNSLGNTIFTMYEQAIQVGSDNLSKKLLNFAVELKHETAIRINQAYKNNSQGDCSMGSSVNTLFKSPS